MLHHNSATLQATIKTIKKIYISKIITNNSSCIMLWSLTAYLLWMPSQCKWNIPSGVIQQRTCIWQEAKQRGAERRREPWPQLHPGRAHSAQLAREGQPEQMEGHRAGQTRRQPITLYGEVRRLRLRLRHRAVQGWARVEPAGPLGKCRYVHKKKKFFMMNKSPFGGP